MHALSYNCHLCSVDKDDDYMFLPMKDRASTYVQRCSIWRHPSLFGITVESDKEEHQELELIRRHLTDSQLAISVNGMVMCPKLSFCCKQDCNIEGVNNLCFTANF